MTFTPTLDRYRRARGFYIDDVWLMSVTQSRVSPLVHAPCTVRFTVSSFSVILHRD